MLDDKPKVSFIIPVYNGEGFIKRCLSSVLSQSYSNIEVIIVNDGSKDNTMNICDIFAQKDVRITAIHTENKGVSSARNLGLSKCTGSLIHFLDADDFISKNALEILVQNHIVTHSDLTIGGFNRVKDSGSLVSKVIEFDQVSVMGREDVVMYLWEYFRNPRKCQMLATCWGKLYNASIIREQGLSFDELLSLSEDIVFNLQYIRSAEIICFLNETTYCHQVYDSFTSLTSSISQLSSTSFFLDRLLDEIFIFFTEQAPDVDVERLMSQYYGYRLITFSVRVCGQVNRQNYRKLYGFFSELSNKSKRWRYINNYKPENGNYRLLPWLLKYRAILLFMFECYRESKKFFKKIDMSQT